MHFHDTLYATAAGGDAWVGVSQRGSTGVSTKSGWTSETLRGFFAQNNLVVESEPCLESRTDGPSYLDYLNTTVRRGRYA